MKETSMKKKLSDYSLVKTELISSNSHLLEKLKFLKNKSKKISELLKKYYKINNNENEYKEFLNEIDNLNSNIKEKISALLTDNSQSKNDHIVLESKMSEHELYNQLSSLKIESFLLKNMIKEKNAIHQKMTNDLINFKKYKIFKESEREIYMFPVNNIQQYNSIVNYNNCSNIDLFHNYQSNKVKKNNKYRKYKMYFLRELMDSLQLNNDNCKTKEIKNKIKQGYLIQLKNNKFNTHLNINLEYFSSQSDCSSLTNEFSIDDSFYDDKYQNYNSEIDINLSCLNTSELFFSSSSSLSSQSDNEKQLNNNQNIKVLIQKLKLIKQEKKKLKKLNNNLKKTMINYEKNAKKMMRHINKLRESLRLSSKITNSELSHNYHQTFSTKSKSTIALQSLFQKKTI